MVTSEQLLDFVALHSTPRVHAEKESGEVAYIEPFLANEELAKALDVVARVVEAETHAALAREQMKIMLTRNGPDFGPAPSFPVPAAN